MVEWGQLQSSLEERLAELGTVPWVIGGDWNADPDEIRAAWRRPGVAIHTGTPTQKFGGNFDWYMHCPRLLLEEPRAEVIPGTDHVGVGVRLPGGLHDLLGYRLIQLAPFTKEQVDLLKSPELRAKLERSLGAPPEDWCGWCAEAEKGLLDVLGVDHRGNTGRGCVPPTRRQQIRPSAQTLPCVH